MYLHHNWVFFFCSIFSTCKVPRIFCMKTADEIKCPGIWQELRCGGGHSGWLPLRPFHEHAGSVKSIFCVKKKSVLRIRIRDLVLSWPLDPVWDKSGFFSHAFRIRKYFLGIRIRTSWITDLGSRFITDQADPDPDSDPFWTFLAAFENRSCQRGTIKSFNF